jgi:antibiotic biosynthesis monooxygenase (ABM) superfamily enzyme
MYKFSEHNFPIQVLATVVWKLEEGMSMFDVTPAMMAAASQSNGNRKIQVRARKSHKTASGSTSSSTASSSPTAYPQQQHNDDDILTDIDDDDDMTEYVHSDSTTCKVLLRIEHRVDPHKLVEYQKWMDKIHIATRQQRGLLEVTCMDMIDDEREHEHEHEHDYNDDAEQEAVHDDRSVSSATRLQVIYCTFANISYLNEWLLSPRRKVLMKELQPLLVKPDVVQIAKDRILPDAFTDLVIAQGQCVPTLPPKKWKVWWLTTLALFTTIRWTRSTLPYYYAVWGLHQPQLVILVGTAMSTFLNSYIMVPLLLFLFHPWMQRHPHEQSEHREPWRTLDNGIQSLWIKAALTFLLYGGCAIAWVVRLQV